MKNIDDVKAYLRHHIKCTNQQKRSGEPMSDKYKNELDGRLHAWRHLFHQIVDIEGESK